LPNGRNFLLPDENYRSYCIYKLFRSHPQKMQKAELLKRLFNSRSFIAISFIRVERQGCIGMIRKYFHKNKI